MIVPLGSDNKLLALSPLPRPRHVILEGDVKEPIHRSIRVRSIVLSAVVCPQTHLRVERRLGDGLTTCPREPLLGMEAS